jgi:aminopeptidase N
MRIVSRLLAGGLAVAFSAGASAIAAPPKAHPRPFGRGAAAFHPTPIPPYRIEHEDVVVAFDEPHSRVDASATIRVVNTGGAARLAFDSIGLVYEHVSLDGVETKAYSTDAGHLIVPVPSADTTTAHTIVAFYHASPKRGIYFVHRNAAYPHREPEIWTQGETIDTRRWMPTWDQPNMKFTTSVTGIVPKAWTFISNGSLVSDTPLTYQKTKLLPRWRMVPSGALHVVTWSIGHPHSSYLTSFVAGPYTKVHDTLGALPVDYYVHPEDAALARTCFGRTPQMIAFFEQFTGTPFAWEKYAQTTVQEFTAGGMENVSATTQSAFAIHPPEFELEASCDSLASHELAHQWFGDDITTVDWPNIWLNEGFATYFQELWSEHHFGADQFAYERANAQQTYFRETQRYWRPIVDYRYGTPQDNFDASGYPRPAQVIHMLRVLLGDDAFRTAIKNYLAEYRYQNVDTREFEHAVERSSGRDLKWFFDEWFYTASYPHYVVTDHYDTATKTLTLDVTQRNHGGVLFRMPVTVVAYVHGTAVTQTLTVHARHGTFAIPGVAAQPEMVLFDAGNNVLRSLDYHKPVAVLAYQAQHAPTVPDRLWAINELGKQDHGSAQVAARAALRDAALHDPFYGVRTGAIDAAAGLDDANTLRLALGDRDPRVVIFAARAVHELDHPADPALRGALRDLTGSHDMQIRAAAFAGYGATKAADARAMLIAALASDSPQDIVARGALDGLGEIADPRTIGAILAKATYGNPERTRAAAITTLGVFAKKHATAAAVVPALKQFAAHDPYFRARTTAIAALAKTKDRSLIPFLANIKATDSEESAQNAAYDAIADITDPPAKK